MKRKYQSITIVVIAMFIVTLGSSSAAEQTSRQSANALLVSRTQVVAPVNGQAVSPAPPRLPASSPSPTSTPPSGDFTEVTTGLPPAQDARWVDYDKDGRLDVLLYGSSNFYSHTLQLYHNNGNGTFSPAFANFIQVNLRGAAWGDYDNDGYPDLAYSGINDSSGIFVTYLYHNNRDGTFTLANSWNNIAGDIYWGDYNNDGRQDFITSGCLGTHFCMNSFDRIFRNDGNGAFTSFTPNLGAYSDAGTYWADFNNDGFLDILATNGNSTRLFLGDGTGNFSLDSATVLGAEGEVTLGDYDSDGWLDIMLGGYLYHNNHDGSFTRVFSPDPRYYGLRLLTSGDYNNDGYLDFAATPYTDNQAIVVYRNEGNNSFTNINATIEAVNGSGYLGWGDYNNDGRLDLLDIGQTTEGAAFTKVYRNNAANDNAPPSIPGSLSATLLNYNAVQLAWQPASDDHTPAAALSYNLRVGTTPGSENIVSAMTLPSGQRLLPQAGNVGEHTVYTLTDLTPGITYYWSVQAIDNGYLGGAFAADGSFTTLIPPSPTPQPTVCPNPFVDINTNIFFHAINSLYCQGVINGTDTSHYNPGGTATRGQFAKLVALAFGLPLITPTSGQSFTDVPPGYFAYVYIESGYHAGILSGFDQQGCTDHQALYPCYLPNVAITRAQLTKLVVNAGGYALLTPASGPTFTDVPPSNVFYAFIETAHAHHIINGYLDGTFRPNNPIRRDEMAQIVYAGQQNQPASPTPINTPAPSMTATPSQTSTPFTTNTPGGPTNTATPTPIPSVTITPTALR